MVPVEWGLLGNMEWLSLVVFFIGAGISVAGVLSFYQQSTTVNPHKPEQATVLVQSGVFQLSRNPMYLGMLVGLVAFGIYFGNPIGLVVLPIFVGYMNRYQIKPEEKSMHQQFGGEYQDYCTQVRRWI